MDTSDDLSFELDEKIKSFMDFACERTVRNRHYSISPEGIIDCWGHVDVQPYLANSVEMLPDYIQFGSIRGSFSISEVKAKSFRGCPKIVKGNFYAENNQLTSFEHAPKEIYGYFSCSKNKLSSLEHIPSVIYKSLFITDNNITNLHDIHRLIKSCHTFYANKNPIKSHVLGLLKIENLTRVGMDNTNVATIINKYLSSQNRSSSDLLDCQEELIEAGFEEYAQL